MTDSDINDRIRAELHEVLVRTESDPSKVALRSIWLHDHIPAVTNDVEYRAYGAFKDAIIAEAETQGVDTQSVAWFHSQDGLLSATYGAKQIE